MPEEKVSQQECKCPTGAKYHVYGCALDGELLAAADAGPRQPDTCKDCGQSIHFEPDGHFVHDERIDHCLAHDRGQWPEPAASPVPQEAAPAPGTVATFMDMRLDTTMPVGQVDVQDSKGRRTIIPATAPDEPLKALRQWEADTEAPANASEGNAFIDGFNAGREAGSERERRLLNWFIKYAEDAEKSWTKDGERTVTAMSWGQAVSEFRAAASRLLGGESK